MPIKGPHSPEDFLVPVIWKGRQQILHQDWLKPYDLDTAQREIEGARNASFVPYDADKAEMLELTITRINGLMRAADEVIHACQHEIAALQERRDRLHSQAAAARYQDAIARLDTILSRHVRTRARLSETLLKLRNTPRASVTKPQPTPR